MLYDIYQEKYCDNTEWPETIICLHHCTYFKMPHLQGLFRLEDYCNSMLGNIDMMCKKHIFFMTYNVLTAKQHFTTSSSFPTCNGTEFNRMERKDVSIYAHEVQLR